LGDVGQRGISAALGGLIGYAISVVANPILTAHHLPTLPESVTTPIGAWVGDKLTATVRARIDSVIEQRRKSKALSTLQTLANEAKILADALKTDPARDALEVLRARSLQGGIEAYRTRATSERGELTIDKLEQAVDDYSEQVRSMTGKSRAQET
jgi:hypothetical protein